MIPRWTLCCVVFALWLPHGLGQVVDCPDDWVAYGLKCYHFVFYPELDHGSARVHCGANGAALVGVKTEAEHIFLSTWLLNNDLSRREFYTSGLIRNLAEGDLIWESDGSRVPPELDKWLSEQDKQEPGAYITYKYGVTQYGWSREPSNTLLPFVCEISSEEAYRITQDNRDFDYGTGIDDPNEVPRGPKFTKEPQDTMLITNMRSVVINCAAFANPSPSYKMYRTRTTTGNTTLITPDMDSRYALTNGMLVISHPTELEDAGTYFCEASNPHGTALSHQGFLSFGNLGEFSNVPQDKVRVRRHSYGILDCMPPSHKPALSYGWMKRSPGNFLRTDLMLHLFPSYNGKLYFTEVGSEDASEYFCMVKLMPLRGTFLATDQPPSRVSLPIEMEVTDSTPVEWGPEIADDFIAVFPRTPLRGQQLRMECLAFGTMPIQYEWRREGLPFPTTTEFLENNRVVEITNVQLEDSGVYYCKASRGTTRNDQKSVTLSIQAAPYFIYELQDKHVDENRRLTWRCEARALPAPTYTWLKNGVVLASVPGDVEISNNVLTVVSPNAERHDGMYQCRANNIHGVSYSTGQLRVLGFAPSFKRNPLQSLTMGALGGTVTIICSPEAAPSPTVTWYRNGIQVGSPEPGARVRVLSNGNIVISQLVTSDAGLYTCRAENAYGDSSSDGQLDVLGRTVISNPPVNTAVMINHTAFLSCHASHDPALDLETQWLFQGYPLNWRDKHYIRGTGTGLEGLYVQGAQKKHNGVYTCKARTTFDTVLANATLTVRAPPGEPAGVIVKENIVGGRIQVAVQWSVADSWGSPVIFYTVQAANNYNNTWRVWKDNIPASSTIVPNVDKRETEIYDLLPWTGYRFRIRATNAYGPGPYSLPTSYYQTSTAPPVRAPYNITEGEGKVGDLNVSWTPVSQEEHGAPGFGYIAYYKLHARPGDPWIKAIAGNAKAYVFLVGSDLFYTRFDVMVGTYNDAGPGPNSTIHTIYSAEDLPIGTARNFKIDRYNSTALDVTWDPIPDNRETMRGKIQGYQINYWQESSGPLIMNHYTGEASSGARVIGLLPNTWYYMDVQVYNTAGLGPRSELYRQRTFKNPILTQPTEIVVKSHGRDSVFVTWRGCSVKPSEETLLGYYMQYWPSTDNIRTNKAIFTGYDNFGVISGLEKNVLYKLRVYPFSRGGDGGSSPDRLFTLGGQLYFDPSTTEVMATAYRPELNVILLSVCAILVFLL